MESEFLLSPLREQVNIDVAYVDCTLFPILASIPTPLPPCVEINAIISSKCT